jgi:large subunit ribosomal protein L2
MLNYFFFKLSSKLVKGKTSSGGRNFLGRVCIKGRCKGNKRLFRYLDFFKRLNSFGFLCRVVYDSNRTAPIGYFLFENGLACYNILVDGIKIGTTVYSGYESYLFEKVIGCGWSVPIFHMRLFSVISSIELRPFSGSKLARSAGSFAILIGKSKDKAMLKLKSGWILYISLLSFAVFGKVSKNLFNIGSFMKAGKMRAFGFKSKVRGVAKNPCDHPHGGGNGKKSKPVVPVNAWGRFAKWTHTKAKKFDKLNRRMFKILS